MRTSAFWVWVMGFGFVASMSMQRSLAQPVLDWVAPGGSGFSADILAAGFIEPTAAGAEPQAWDFSDISGNAVGLVSVSPANTSAFVSLFDGAEWVAGQGDQLSFWMMDEGDFTVLGNANAAVGITLPFDDPLVQWSYPMAYGEEIQDTFGTSLMLLGQPYELVGTANSVVDAWGSLVMPGGTVFPEVLRGNYQQEYTEVYDGDTAHWSLNQVMYFVPDSALPVFFHEALLVTDNAGTVLLEVTDVAWYANGVAQVQPMDERMTAPFPNPADEGQWVTWKLPEGWHWQALDMKGRIVSEGEVVSGQPLRLDTRGWKSGVVLLVALDEQGEARGGVQRLLIR